MEGVDFVGVVQELFVSVDAQLEKTDNRRSRGAFKADSKFLQVCLVLFFGATCVLTCCSGAVTRLAQLSHSITMMDRKRQAARIQRGRPERLQRDKERQMMAANTGLMRPFFSGGFSVIPCTKS